MVWISICAHHYVWDFRVARKKTMKYLLALSLALAGCGTIGFFGSSPKPPEPVVEAGAGTGTKLNECPQIDVRDGAAVHKLTSGKGDGPLDIRYQMTITDVARECWQDGNGYRVKVGVAGRVVVGPLGGAGTISLPIRIAVFKDLNTPLWSGLYQEKQAIPANTPNVLFTMTQEFAITAPSLQEFVNFDIFVGFDPKGTNDPVKRTTKKKN
jgi:hypothetical protein